ncbi:MAG: glycosyltransferase [Moorea sp. SIO1F2]|uniref:glycosyltransferase n=1 Tax=Moorena sp. SIO1F2 TaxID=2607819 RepID=UPI0013BAF8B7|nr:glycosyltransferase [Moorena sp. SIO1F2]NET85958.1 glycosyltransferase [Moorena sp. SIO1F2]
MKLLYYSPASYGGLADYAHYQANALVSAGAEVTLLTTPNYPVGRGEAYEIVPILDDTTASPGVHKPMPKVLKAGYLSYNLLSNIARLIRFIEEHRFCHVLMGSYLEYLAPLWAHRLRQLANRGVVFGAVVHDPVRDFVLGPQWWHRCSIAAGYSFLREAFVHEAIDLDTVRPMPQLRTTVIPHGIYELPQATQSREKMCNLLDLPPEAKVMLSFGHIRPNKNLDLVIEAMARVPEVYLVVAGKEQSSSQQLARRYQELAQELGVADRCRWQIGFIPEREIPNLFDMSDLVLLTYDQTFHSASGVLSMATHHRKLCLASSGEGPLKEVVQKYQLGLWVEPNSVTAIVEGLKSWLKTSVKPCWQEYFRDNSWPRNSELVIKAFSSY